MYSDSKEISRVSQNLYLRRSPDRKYPSRNNFSSSYSNNLNYLKNSSRLRNSKSYKCYPVNCCNYCCCPCCCYYCCCCCLNFDYNSNSISNKYTNNYNSIYPSNKINDPYRKSFDKYGYSSTIRGSTKNKTFNNPPNQSG